MRSLQGHGALASWPTLIGVVVGLLLGTDLGARGANKLAPDRLRATLIFFVSLMALYMVYRALS